MVQPHSVEAKQASVQQSQEKPEDSEKECADDDCFGCCSHAIAGYFFMEPAPGSSAIASSRAASYENKHPNSDLKHLFRPPQIA